MRRLVCLNQHQSFRAATTPGTARHLLKHVESPFAGTEIRKIYNGIGIQHSHGVNTPEIKPLGNHLCPHKDSRLPR